MPIVIVVIPNDTSSESSRRDASRADVFGTETARVPTEWSYRPWKIGPGGCDGVTVLYLGLGCDSVIV